MASFIYKAKTSSGLVVTGKYDATDRNAVVALLKGKGYYPITIDEDKFSGREFSLNSLKRVSSKDLAVFCKQFHTMLNSGVTVIGCLDMLRKQTENVKLAETLNKVYDNVQKGITLADSFAMYPNIFPVILTRMVQMGEVSGTLDSVLNKMGFHFDKDNRIRQKVKTAMTYPAVIGSIALLMVLFMLVFIIPNFVNMFNSFGAVLPLPTRILLKVSNSLTDIRVMLPLIFILIILGYFFKKFKESKKGKTFLDNLIIKTPVVGKNISKILASRFTRTLSSLLSSGVPLIQSLEIVDKVVDNQLVSKGMVKVMDEVKTGASLSSTMEEIGIFPVMVRQMVSVGEESGSLDSIIEKVADFYDDEVDASISRLIALMEPLMIFLMALVVGAIVVSMILPIFSMYGSIGK